MLPHPEAGLPRVLSVTAEIDHDVGADVGTTWGLPELPPRVPPAFRLPGGQSPNSPTSLDPRRGIGGMRTRIDSHGRETFEQCSCVGQAQCCSFGSAEDYDGSA